MMKIKNSLELNEVFIISASMVLAILMWGLIDLSMVIPFRNYS